MSTEDQEAQEEELLALASIYSEDEYMRTDAAPGGEIYLCLDLPSDFVVSIKSNSATNSYAHNFENTVSFLPPIVLTFELPPGYPSTTPPNFTLSCKWLSPAQVKDLVDEQLFRRYDRLLLQSSLDLMADVVYCPRRSCQTPVVQENYLDKPMGICSACKYAFCLYCKMAFHGFSPCHVSSEKFVELAKEYIMASRERKKEMVKIYGSFDKAVEDMNKKWIRDNSKPCPNCKSPIQKIDGCNKMTCTACKKFFCWVCLKILCPENPYKHFDTPVPCM